MGWDNVRFSSKAKPPSDRSVQLQVAADLGLTGVDLLEQHLEDMVLDTLELGTPAGVGMGTNHGVRFDGYQCSAKGRKRCNCFRWTGALGAPSGWPSTRPGMLLDQSYS